MLKKTTFTILSFILLITLTACPDKEQSKQQNNTEIIPNTMQKASDELEQIITLLGGPLFNGRDNIEQMKNEQLQMLLESIQKITLGTQDKGQLQPDGGAEEEKKQEGGKSQQSGQDTGQEESKGGKEGQNGQQGEEKNEQQGEQKDKESGGGSEKDKPGQENEGKQDGTEKTEDNIEKENSGEKAETQKPGTTTQETAFQYEESLFGIPQWHENNWKMIKVLADGMHFTWNNLQPELIKKGVSQTQIENFNKALVALSQNVNTKNIKESQTAAFQLFQALSDFYSYYKTEIPAELPRITSGVTGIHFSVKQNNWPQAQELANQLQQEFAKLKANVEDNQNHIFQMLELSVNDLCNAVYNQDPVLVLIRTNLVNSNIHELDVKLSQKQQ